MDKCDPTNTQMATTTKLDYDLHGKPVNPKLHRSMIGSLMYLTSSRPDIHFCCMFISVISGKDYRESPQRGKKNLLIPSYVRRHGYMVYERIWIRSHGLFKC